MIGSVAVGERVENSMRVRSKNTNLQPVGQTQGLYNVLIDGAVQTIAANGCELQLDALVDVFDVRLINGIVFENDLLIPFIAAMANIVYIDLFVWTTFALFFLCSFCSQPFQLAYARKSIRTSRNHWMMELPSVPPA